MHLSIVPAFLRLPAHRSLGISHHHPVYSSTIPFTPKEKMLLLGV